jgi:L-lactate dehydrogenase complex protein LldG
MSSLTAKSNILNKLRSAVSDSYSTVELPLYQWQTQTEPLEVFCKLLADNQAKVIRVAPEQVAVEIKAIIAERGFRNPIASDRALRHYPQLEELAGTLPMGNISTWKDFLFKNVDLGITTAAGAIANTGTLILRTGADEPRSLSLVPPAHLVLVQSSTLVNDLEMAMEQLHWNTNMPTNLVLLSGPSKTADIQQTLAFGAHGPRELYVILING